MQQTQAVSDKRVSAYSSTTHAVTLCLNILQYTAVYIMHSNEDFVLLISLFLANCQAFCMDGLNSCLFFCVRISCDSMQIWLQQC